MFQTMQALTGHENRITVEKLYCDAMGGDLLGGVFLSELIFWSGKGGREDGFFFRTAQDWQDRCYLSPYLVRKYAGICEEFGWLETKKMMANGSPTIHYRISLPRFTKWISQFVDGGAKAAAQPEEKPQPAKPAINQYSSLPGLPSGTAQDWTKASAKGKKYFAAYSPKQHRAIFDAVVEIMGKKALVDAEHAPTLTSLQEAAVILYKGGATAEDVIQRGKSWGSSFFGKNNGTPNQFVSFILTQAPASTGTQAGTVNLNSLLQGAIE